MAELDNSCKCGGEEEERKEFSFNGRRNRKKKKRKRTWFGLLSFSLIFECLPLWFGICTGLVLDMTETTSMLFQ